MGGEIMDLEELATYLRRDQREVSKMASRGYLPGQKVSGNWRFHRAEINQWIETQLPGYTEQQLTALEGPDDQGQPLITSFLTEASVAVPMRATTRVSVLRELVRLAEQSWNVYDPDAVFGAIKAREEIATTALPSGVAIPHPRRPLPLVLGESVIAYGRTAHGIPFGGERGALTDVFFLVCCRDDRTHMQVLARLSRLLLRPGFLDELRAAETPGETFQRIEAEEKALLGG